MIIENYLSIWIANIKEVFLKMGIFNRLATVIKSNINELISRSEDPKKMLEQI